MLIERSRRIGLKKNMMERLLAMRSEEKASKRKTVLYQYPCYFLDGAISALLKCLGVETATQKQEIKSSHLIKPHSGADLDPVITTPKTSATNIKKKASTKTHHPQQLEALIMQVWLQDMVLESLDLVKGCKENDGLVWIWYFEGQDLLKEQPLGIDSCTRVQFLLSCSREV